MMMSSPRPSRTLALILLLALAGPVWNPPAGAQTTASPGAANKGYISVREFADSQGIAFQWFPLQKMVVLTRGQRIMRLVVDSTSAVVDNQPFMLPSPPRIQEGQLYVPARSIFSVFGSSEPSVEEDPDPEAASMIPAGTADPGPPPQVLPPPPETTVAEPVPAVVEEPSEDQVMLVTARHSRREDQTRVVLEFDGRVTYHVETPAEGKFKLRISGCKNLIPTKRSNPVGRDLKGISYHGGPNRSGLVVNFDLFEGGGLPKIESVADPFRLIVTIPSPPGAITASGTAALTASAPAALKPGQASGTAAIAKPEVPSLAKEPLPELTFEVPLASLTRAAFLGRTILIDPGHGGTDSGVSVSDLPPEKTITLGVALELKKVLKNLGFMTYVLRSQDTALTAAERLAQANRNGADLVVSLHVGGSGDDNQEGVACFTYASAGVQFDNETGARLSPHLVYNEWLQTTRLDLARFLAIKIRDRLVQHLPVKDRGVRPLPLLPLRFQVYPAVLVELGMLTHPQEGRKLATKGFQEAAARAIGNGVVDFFNGIRITP